MPRRSVALLLLPWVAWLAASCRTQSRTNVLLITIDTLRNDHCSVSGYSRPTTPRLEQLAQEGARMALAYAPCATTLPTHASIFTSLYPIAHGVLKNGIPLDGKFTTLAEVLRGRGYATAAIVSSFVLNSKFGLDQGFDTYDDDLNPATASIHQERFVGHEVTGGFDQRADEATRKASAVLRRLVRDAKPFFLFVHYFDPHSPYAAPPEWAARFRSEGHQPGTLPATIDAYDAEIAFADSEVGRLLDTVRELGLERSTLVVMTADHGEGLMQHGHMEHGVNIYEEAVRVPLLFRLPGRIGAGRVLAEPVELLDIVPTALELSGEAPVPDLEGRTLAGALTSGAPLDPERPIYLYRRHYVPGYVDDVWVAGEKFGLRSGPWKYIVGEAEGTRELFNLADDPHELVNLHASSGEVAKRMDESLAAWRRRFTPRDPSRVSPEDLEKLRQLGYVE